MENDENNNIQENADMQDGHFLIFVAGFLVVLAIALFFLYKPSPSIEGTVVEKVYVPASQEEVILNYFVPVTVEKPEQFCVIMDDGSAEYKQVCISEVAYDEVAEGDFYKPVSVAD